MNITYNETLNKFYNLVRDGFQPGADRDVTHRYVQMNGRNLRVSQAAEPWYRTYWNRSDANKRANNDIRAVFKREIELFFHGHVPESVKEAMKWDDYDGKGRTLSLFRIKATFDAITREVSSLERPGMTPELREDELNTTLDSLVRRGDLQGVIGHLYKELAYIERHAPPGDALIKVSLGKIYTQLAQMYDEDRKSITSPEAFLEFGKTVEEVRKLTVVITAPGNAGFAADSCHWNRSEQSIDAAKALRRFCERTELRYLLAVGRGCDMLLQIGYGLNRRPNLPEGVRLDRSVRGAGTEVAMLYEGLKRFKDRSKYPSGLFVENLLRSVKPEGASHSLDQVLDDVWVQLKSLPESTIRRLLMPSDDLSLDGYAINGNIAFDEMAKKHLSTGMSPLGRYVINEYFRRNGQPAVFVALPGMPPNDSLEVVKMSLAGRNPVHMRASVCEMLDQIDLQIAPGNARFRATVRNLRMAVEGAMAAQPARDAERHLASAVQTAGMEVSDVLQNVERAKAADSNVQPPPPGDVRAALALKALCETLQAGLNLHLEGGPVQNLPAQPNDESFGAIHKTGGKGLGPKKLDLYRVLKRLLIPQSLWVASNEGYQLKNLLISRYKNNVNSSIDDNLNINQEIQFKNSESLDQFSEVELDERITKSLDGLIERWWSFLAVVKMDGPENEQRNEDDVVNGRFNEFLRVGNGNGWDFDLTGGQNAAWKLNEEYADDAELKTLLDNLKAPIEKIIVDQIFQEFNLPPVFVNTKTGLGLPPMALPEKG